MSPASEGSNQHAAKELEDEWASLLKKQEQMAAHATKAPLQASNARLPRLPHHAARRPSLPDQRPRSRKRAKPPRSVSQSRPSPPPSPSLPVHSSGLPPSQRDHPLTSPSSPSSSTATATLSHSPSPHTSPTIRLLCIAVLGASRCGKSTFIANALGIDPRQEPPYNPAKLKLRSANGSTYAVRLLEIDFEDAPVQTDGSIIWPDKVQDLPVENAPDGAFVLYDPSSRASLHRVAPTLGALQYSSIPAALVAAKWDTRPSHRRLGPDQLEQSSLLADPSLALRSSSNIPESARYCLSTLLQALTRKPATDVDWLLDQNLALRGLRPRRHTASRNQNLPQRDSRHVRAASEFSVSSSQRPEEDPLDTVVLPSKRRELGLRVPLQKSQGSTPIASPSDEKAQLSLDLRQLPQSQLTSGISEAPHDSFYEEPEEPLFSDDASMDSAASNQNDDTASLQPASVNVAYTFPEIVDKLLVTPTDEKAARFSASFLALYRLFAAPCELLELILHHFEVYRDPNVFVKSLGSPLNDLSILRHWLNEFPGDFAHEHIRKSLKGFLLRLSDDPEQQTTAAELLMILESSCIETEDTQWGNTDDLLERGTAFSSLSLCGPLKTSSDTPQSAFEYLTTIKTYSLESDMRSNSVFSHSSSTLGVQPQNGSFTDSQSTIASEAAIREIESMTANPTVPLTKEAWRTFMTIADRSIAKELTRIDHAMFRLIKPRDLIRHAMLAPEARTAYPGTESVNRMIDHFNRLFLFCCNLILFRDKPKHRAIALAKLMAVGRELRKLNNYNALGAVVAGLKSSSVSRLGATWDLIDESRKRDFERLGMLMSTSRGHNAYRMAWENSFGERIPFLALHRRDLMVASQNRTFMDLPFAEAQSASSTAPSSVESPVSDNTPTPTSAHPSVDAKKINWRKFEIMGDTLSSIRDAQEKTAYADIITPNDQVRTIVLNSRIVDDEEALYEWSTQLEAGVLGNAAAATTSPVAVNGGGVVSVEHMRRRLGQFKKHYGLG